MTGSTLRPDASLRDGRADVTPPTRLHLRPNDPGYPYARTPEPRVGDPGPDVILVAIEPFRVGDLAALPLQGRNDQDRGEHGHRDHNGRIVQPLQLGTFGRPGMAVTEPRDSKAADRGSNQSFAWPKASSAGEAGSAAPMER